MKSIKFANKRALLITSNNTKKIVKTKIKNIANINIDYKNYKLLKCQLSVYMILVKKILLKEH